MEGWKESEFEKQKKQRDRESLEIKQLSSFQVKLLLATPLTNNNILV